LFQCRTIEETSSAKSLTGPEGDRTSECRNENPLDYSTTSRGIRKNAQNVPYNSLAVALCISGGEATAIVVERAAR
jgi:hypothetical protein